MPELQELLEWALSGEGRLIAAAVLFLLMWALKHVPIVKTKLLTTPRRKQAASLFMAMAPAVWLLVEGAPPVEVISTAVMVALASNGLNTYRPSKAKKS